MNRAPKPEPRAPIVIDAAMFDRLMQLQLAIDEVQATLDEIAAVISPPKQPRPIKAAKAGRR